MFPKYDIIIVGAGHAGCEAAAAAATLGSKVLLVTMNLQTIAQMSCNPAMGGIAKGQIIREIDALGGYSGIVTDESMVQFRMLNRSKGAAMWSPRAQCDRQLFSAKWRAYLEKIPFIDFYQDSVIGLLKNRSQIAGIKTARGHLIESKAVILTTGTFLNGIIHVGSKQTFGGRISENSSTGITEELISWGFESSRLKTGTPPRIDARSLDFSKMEEQKGDEQVKGFSYLNTKKPTKQLSCWITYTNSDVHDILKSGFKDSPMFQGRIQGIGPRYCPSIEDKINRFSERDRHQLFVEPEGFNSIEMYLNGFSSSLPEEIQFRALQKIPGFENCKIFRPGYAIEYDFFQPTQLNSTLETKRIKHLFFAGQINGTTGYEEAASQGLMAGINAHCSVNELHPFVLKRNEAYIGVLIDDLVNKGTNEPYRMFTSRAEYRLLLRQDNADIRLTPKGYVLGLAHEERNEIFKRKQALVNQSLKDVKEYKVQPSDINVLLTELGSSPINHSTRVAQLLGRPEIHLGDLFKKNIELNKAFAKYPDEVIDQVEIQIKYSTYFDKEEESVSKLKNLENQLIPDNFNYDKITSISNESRQKFNDIKPKTLGQASRISGVKPSDVQVLMVYIRR